MIDQIKELIAEAEAFKAQTKEEVEAYRIKLLGQKGIVKQYFAEFKNVANDQKKEFGQVINTLKKTAEEKIQNSVEEIEELVKSQILERIQEQDPYFFETLVVVHHR